MLTNTNIVRLRPKRSLPYPFELVVPRPPYVCSSPHARCLPSSSRPFRVKRDRLIARHSYLSRIFQHQHLLAIGLLLAFKWSLSQLGSVLPASKPYRIHSSACLGVQPRHECERLLPVSIVSIRVQARAADLYPLNARAGRQPPSYEAYLARHIHRVHSSANAFLHAPHLLALLLTLFSFQVGCSHRLSKHTDTSRPWRRGGKRTGR